MNQAPECPLLGELTWAAVAFAATALLGWKLASLLRAKRAPAR
ncbi:MAG: hypothetical protein ABSH47_10780 [Bryobacteraceae bacterium]